MKKPYSLHVGDIVNIRHDILEETAADPGELTSWYLTSGRDDTFTITQIDDSDPDTPYLLNKFFCETYFSADELNLVTHRTCSLPIGTKVRINRQNIAPQGENSLLEWFRLFGDESDVFTIVGYSDTRAPYVLDRYMGETSFFETELIPVTTEEGAFNG